jgi:dephospho-CoA kinase
MDVVFLPGPPAAGKLTTARFLEQLVGFPVFHDQLVVDLLTGFFP